MAEMTDLRTLGALTAARLRAVGIDSRSRLESLGALTAWRRVRKAFPGETRLPALFAMRGALLDVYWSDAPDTDMSAS